MFAKGFSLGSAAAFSKGLQQLTPGKGLSAALSGYSEQDGRKPTAFATSSSTTSQTGAGLIFHLKC